MALRPLRPLRLPLHLLASRLGTVSALARRGDGCLPVPMPEPPCVPHEQEVKPDPEPQRSSVEGADPRDPRVVVIGAGVAGLNAAAHLVKQGLSKVTVLEARDRPGGRLQSSFLGDVVVELGAPWPTFRHVADNVAVRRALDDGFLPGTFGRHCDAPTPLGVPSGAYPCNPMRADAARTLFVGGDGMPLPNAVVQRAYDMARNIEDDALDLHRHCGRGDALDEAVGRRVRLELQSVPAEHRDATARVLTGLLCARRMRSPRDHAYLGHNHAGPHLGLPGAGFRVPLGHVASLEPLLKTLGAGRVRYEKAVETVRWGLVRGQRAVVACEDGDEFPADHVIVALPLGVLKRQHAAMFLPGLPCPKIEAIQQLRVQPMNRVFLDYDRPFWLWLESAHLDRALADATTGPGHRDEGARWLRGLDAVRAVRGSSHVLRMDVLGDAAVDLELCSDHQVIESVTRFLRQCSGDVHFPRPSRLVRTRWSGDPATAGSLTVRPEGPEGPEGGRGEQLSRALAEPVHHVLFFAGEATSHRYLSTVRGAALSGVREADRVLERVESARQEGALQRAACC